MHEERKRICLWGFFPDRGNHTFYFSSQVFNLNILIPSNVLFCYSFNVFITENSHLIDTHQIGELFTCLIFSYVNFSYLSP